ncbi:hypothetical protein D0894_07690 [Pseudomonas monteilii]|uniref:Uncharacterized protein n=1 Tax=Pseudomonas monteilii TaxID=76759 RepID=A0A399MAJ4_9PSED|nr:hypothetical protein D0894_07690 [Pseudomonas monteilii]
MCTACRIRTRRRPRLSKQAWPLRGQARSHRSYTCIGTCAVLVGAGLPAKRPALTTVFHRQTDLDQLTPAITRFIPQTQRD